mmetsp:Transcript_4690/g.14169  ORF Transcript_4690/g.14169 Transcript_4690/m.14169 type:complete len:475 (-) Transcript_4690:2177-3601(-)
MWKETFVLATLASAVLSQSARQTNTSRLVNDGTLSVLLDSNQVSTRKSTQQKILERCQKKTGIKRNGYSLCHCHAKRLAAAGLDTMTADIAVGCCEAVYVKDLATANPNYCCDRWYSDKDYDKFLVASDGTKLCPVGYDACEYSYFYDNYKFRCDGFCLDPFEPKGCEDIACSPERGTRGVSCTADRQQCGSAFKKDVLYDQWEQFPYLDERREMEESCCKKAFSEDLGKCCTAKAIEKGNFFTCCHTNAKGQAYFRCMQTPLDVRHRCSSPNVAGVTLSPSLCTCLYEQAQMVPNSAITADDGSLDVSLRVTEKCCAGLNKKQCCDQLARVPGFEKLATSTFCEPPKSLSDPCEGKCPDGMSCVVRGTIKKTAFCINCSLFVTKVDGMMEDCCHSTADGCKWRSDRQDVSCVRGKDEIRCKSGASCVSPLFTSPMKVGICHSFKDFRRNGGVCKIVKDKNNNTVCSYSAVSRE